MTFIHLFMPRRPYEVALTGPPWEEHEGGFHPKSLLIRPSVIQRTFIHRVPGIVPVCRESGVAEAPAAMASGLPNLLTFPASFINQSIDLPHHSYTFFFFWLPRSFQAPSLLNSSRIEFLLL